MAALSSPQPLVVGEAASIPKESSINHGQTVSFATLLHPKPTDSIVSKTNLKPIEIIHGIPTLQFTTDERQQFAKEEGLHQAIVVKLSMGAPDLATLRSILPKCFGIKGHCLIGLLAPRHLLLRFDQYDDFVSGLARSVTFYKHKGKELQVRVFPWSIGFNPNEETTMAVVWISLPNLSPEFFAKKALLSIASAVGKPIAIDKPTQTRSRPSTARVRVILDLSDKLPDKVRLQYIDSTTGKIVEEFQKIIYDNLPSYCCNCKHQGHEEIDCRRSKRNAMAEPQSTFNDVSKLDKGPNTPSTMDNLQVSQLEFTVADSTLEKNREGQMVEGQPGRAITGTNYAEKESKAGKDAGHGGKAGDIVSVQQLKNIAVGQLALEINKHDEKEKDKAENEGYGNMEKEKDKGQWGHVIEEFASSFVEKATKKMDQNYVQHAGQVTQEKASAFVEKATEKMDKQHDKGALAFVVDPTKEKADALVQSQSQFTAPLDVDESDTNRKSTNVFKRKSSQKATAAHGKELTFDGVTMDISNKIQKDGGPTDFSTMKPTVTMPRDHVEFSSVSLDATVEQTDRVFAGEISAAVEQTDRVDCAGATTAIAESSCASQNASAGEIATAVADRATNGLEFSVSPDRAFNDANVHVQFDRGVNAKKLVGVGLNTSNHEVPSNESFDRPINNNQVTLSMLSSATKNPRGGTDNESNAYEDEMSEELQEAVISKRKSWADIAEEHDEEEENSQDFGSSTRQGGKGNEGAVALNELTPTNILQAIVNVSAAIPEREQCFTDHERSFLDALASPNHHKIGFLSGSKTTARKQKSVAKRHEPGSARKAKRDEPLWMFLQEEINQKLETNLRIASSHETKEDELIESCPEEATTIGDLSPKNIEEKKVTQEITLRQLPMRAAKQKGIASSTSTRSNISDKK